MSVWKIAFPLIYKTLNPEAAHRAAFSFLKKAAAFSPRSVEILAGTNLQKRTRVWDLNFRSPLGLAAGFDKNAEIVAETALLGFGFTEIGTVTPKPQQGNPKPRLFRETESRSLFNRMGFNNEGADKIAARLSRVRTKAQLPQDFRIGVNLGKNKDTPDAEAASDYQKALKPFLNLADYVVINVSSPNTPGLRALQTAENLKPIIDAVAEELSLWKKRPPLIVKVAPELGEDGLKPLFETFDQNGKSVQGWILTNTLKGEHLGLQGGWSGGRLRDVSASRLGIARSLTSSPIISVGGIMTEQDAIKRFQLGANLIQIYSGWIFEGPRFPHRILKALGASA